MTGRIQFRRGITAQWNASNPILKSGEIGIVLDTAITVEGVKYYQFKVGESDTSHWADLPFAAFAIPSTAVEWGNITGTITDQADLVSYIAAQIAAVINSAPGALDTLDELAAALGDDANFATTVTNALAGKVAGPASATANNFALYDGTTGKLIKDTGKKIYSDPTFASPTANDIPDALNLKTWIESGAGNGITDIALHSDASATWVYTNQPNSVQRYSGTDRHVVKFHTSKFKSIRLLLQVITASTSANTPHCWAEYSTDGSAYTKIGSGGGSEIISLASTGKKETTWIIIPAGMVDKDVYLAMGCTGGDGVADPALMSVHIQLR